MKKNIWIRKVGRELNIRLSGILHFSKTILQILWTMLWVKAFLYVYLLREEGREFFLEVQPLSERVAQLNGYLFVILLGILGIEGIFLGLRIWLRKTKAHRSQVFSGRGVPEAMRLHAEAVADRLPSLREGAKESPVLGKTKALARAGVAFAQCSLGKIYERGAGVPRDLGQAVYWYQAASQQGHAEAQCLLGLCRLEGLGVEPDKHEAETLFRSSSAAGWAEAQYQLAQLLDLPERREEEKAEAILWLDRAARQGHLRARRDLTDRIPRNSSLKFV